MPKFEKTLNMASLGDFLNKLAISAGVDPSNEHLKNLLASSDLSKIDINDDLAKTYTSGLLTLDAARNSENLRNHFYALFMNGGEAKFAKLASEIGLSDDDVLSITKDNKSGWDRYAALAKKVGELEREKAGKGKLAKEEIDKEIARLNEEARLAKEQAQKTIEENNSKWHSRLQNNEIRRMLSDMPYAFDLPKDVNVDTAMTLLNRKIQENKLKVSYNPDNNQLRLLTENDLEYHKDNTPVSLSDFTRSVLSESKMLKVSGGEQHSKDKQADIKVEVGKGLNPAYVQEMEAQINSMLKS